MEKAIYITNPSYLEYWNNKYNRLYFGIEFCERLIPSPNDLNEVIDFAKKKRIMFSLVTPYVTDTGLKRIDKLLSILKNKMPFSEVIINDWGVLKIINKKHKKLKPVLGRLLNKMKREPRIMNLIDRLPKEAMDELKSSEVCVKAFQEILKEQNIKRIEFDNVLQGINNLNLRELGFTGSLYLPFAYVTTTRLCLSNSCGEYDYTHVGIFPCKKECQKFSFKLKHGSLPVDLILKGNTQFFKNNKIPKNLNFIGIDRIIYQPKIPI